MITSQEEKILIHRKIEPRNDWFVAELLKQEDRTSFGLLLVGGDSDVKPQLAKVVAVGPGKYKGGARCPFDVGPGDTVYVTKGEMLPIPDSDLVLMQEGYILAKLEEDETVTPYWDKVLIELVEREVTTAAGVVYFSGDQKGYDHGVVVAVGPGFTHNGKRLPTEVTAGDKVFFTQFQCVEFPTKAGDSRKLFLGREYDIYMAVEKL